MNVVRIPNFLKKRNFKKSERAKWFLNNILLKKIRSNYDACWGHVGGGGEGGLAFCDYALCPIFRRWELAAVLQVGPCRKKVDIFTNVVEPEPEPDPEPEPEPELETEPEPEPEP